jgi:argininosuccinate lyase
MKNPRRLVALTRCMMLPAAAALLAAPAGAAEPRHDAFYFLSQMNKASAVMVVEQRIVPKPLGATIARAVRQVIVDQEKPGSARSGDYLKVEQLLIAVGGPDVTRLHSGRSRQDIGSTSRRLFLRDDLLAAFGQLNELRATLIAIAEKNPNAIVPAYTWGVQAQPISFGHYILGYTQALSRDAERYRQAYVRLNMSPLGAAALGTSSFPVNRPRLAELLGFDGVVENSLDANQISPIDTGIEMSSVAASSALTISTLIADITAQYAQTRPWLLLAEGELTGGSSIMPQKRNPVGMVAVCTVEKRLAGGAQTYYLLAHNVGAGMGDYKADQPDRVLREAADLYAALGALMKDFVFDDKRALAEVNADYSTTTELADTLQRVGDVPFRVGHHFASELVNFGRGNSLKPIEIPYAEAQRIYTEAARLFGINDARLPLTEAQFRTSLTAENMVQASQGLGGPQPAEVARMLAAQKAGIAADRAWLDAARGRLAQASEKLDAAFARLMDAR